ncbi:hypothetical protein [Cylindrospermum sp. FACHB-282]|uniref:hypothetical protein n=1 Tax=Cylindrospermum sp. FACHB-282 TaxID=2692794 RepID=UPI001681F632|nr:hypothetical protein [Cylindrospermum sp. FACHB-282]MBD2388837.1 hypothetical protein [Cylindrospermum sp. FACHB-282]
MISSNSELEIAALKYLQATIIRYLKLIYNKNYNKIKSRKNVKKIIDKIKNISDQISYNISEILMQPLDNLDNNEIKLINNLIDKIKNISDQQIHDDISQIQPVDLGNSGINDGELPAYISQNEDLKYFQQAIQEIHREIMHIHDLIESEMIIAVEDIFFPDGSILLVQIYFWKMTLELELGSFSLMKYVFRKIGLPYPNWILPTSTFEGHIFLNILKDAYEENLTVDEMFINKLMVQSRIQDTLDSWKTKNNSNIQKRIPILEEAVAAHLDGKFYLSVSALIPQIEGLLRDAINIGIIFDF